MKYELKKIIDVADIISGGTPKSSNPSYFGGATVWLTPKDLSKHSDIYINSSERTLTDEGIKNSSAKVIPEGSVTLSSRAPIGYVAISTKPFTTNQGMKSFVPKEDLYNEYLYYYLLYSKSALEIEGSGTTFKEISKSKLEQFPIPIPLISEQKRIVSKIKECFTLLDKSEAKLKQAEKKLQDTILSARLKAFISNNTTFKQIGELAEVITKGSTPTSYGYPYIESGINFIKVESIEDQMINQARINCFISEEANNFLSRSKLHEDDILFSIAGTIGKVAIVEKNILPANTNQALAIIRGYKKYFKPKYLYYFLQSAAIEELKQKARGGAMNNISLNDIKSFNIPTTDFETQEKVIQYLEKTESVIKKSLKSIFTKSDQIKSLRQSILKKAFEGKLI